MIIMSMTVAVIATMTMAVIIAMTVTVLSNTGQSHSEDEELVVVIQSSVIRNAERHAISGDEVVVRLCLIYMFSH
jgi:hypothetical protein